MTISIAAEATQATAIAAALQPASSSASGASTADDPEDERGNRHEPESAEHLRLANGAPHRPAARRLGVGRRQAQSPRSENDGQAGQPHEHRSRADMVGERADDRAEQRAEDRRADGRPEHLPAARAGRPGNQPRERAGPGERAAEPLREPGQPERPGVPREAEGEARHAHDREPDEERAARPVARGRDPTRQCAEDGACGVGAHEQPRGRLGEAELVGVTRQERYERRVEHRLHEDDAADEEEQAAHGPMLVTRLPAASEF